MVVRLPVRNLLKLAGIGEPRGVHGDAEQHEDEGGQQTAHTSEPERLEIETSRCVVFREEEAGDEEAADDEECIDAKEAATGPGHAGVVGDDGRDGEAAQAIDRREVGDAARVGWGHASWGLPAGGIGGNRDSQLRESDSKFKV